MRQDVLDKKSGWLKKSLISDGKSLPAHKPKHASGAPEPPDWSGSRNPPHSWSFPVKTKLRLMQSLMRFKTTCCKQKVDAFWEPDFGKTLRGTLQVKFRSKNLVVEDTIDVLTLSCALIFMRFRPKSSCNCNAKRAWGAKKVFSEKKWARQNQAGKNTVKEFSGTCGTPQAAKQNLEYRCKYAKSIKTGTT